MTPVDIPRHVPGAAAGGSPEDLGPSYPPVLHLHLQPGPAELLGEGVDRLDTAGVEGAADLVDLDVDPVAVGDLLQLWDRSRPPDPAGDDDGLGAALPGPDGYLRGDVGVEGVGDDQL